MCETNSPHLFTNNNGAEDGTRTRTGIHPLSPEPSASTNSATSAQKYLAIFLKKTYPYAHCLSTIYVTDVS